MYVEYMKFTLFKKGKCIASIELHELAHNEDDIVRLQYRLQVWHKGKLVKEIEINTFHLALFTFHKSIDAEVKANVQG